MGHAEESSPEEEPRPDVLSGQVEQAAEVIAHGLAEAEDDSTRRELLHTVAERLLSQDVVVVDAHTSVPHDDDPLKGERGKQTGRTRERVLLEVRIIQMLGLNRRPRRGRQ